MESCIPVPPGILPHVILPIYIILLSEVLYSFLIAASGLNRIALRAGK